MRILRKSIMKRIEAQTLELAYAKAAEHFDCSVTALQVEIVQFPSNGLFGLFRKSAVIIAHLPNKKLLNLNSTIEESTSIETDTNFEIEELELDDSFYHQEDDYEEESYEEDEYDDERMTAQECADEVQEQIIQLFKNICFDVDTISVSVYDDDT